MHPENPEARVPLGSHTPFVSVIMPIRNEADFIARSLGAVLEQDYPGECMEVLVADGLSTDSTREVIVHMAASHPTSQSGYSIIPAKSCLQDLTSPWLKLPGKSLSVWMDTPSSTRIMSVNVWRSCKTRLPIM